jgi:hypothetical protein
VGRWERETTCEELIAALEKAGLAATEPAMLEGNGLVEGTKEDLAKKPDICAGATPRVHSHFFDAGGHFGSLDWTGQRVDDGTYKLIDEHTLAIGEQRFTYRISGDTLALDPVLTPHEIDQALGNPLEFSQAGWAVAVSYPGHTWRRVPCEGWC